MTTLQINLTPLLATTPATEMPPAIQLDVPPAKRCACCRKKLTLTDDSCSKCQTRFCRAHFLPETHSCSYNFKKDATHLPRVVADKLGGARI